MKHRQKCQQKELIRNLVGRYQAEAASGKLKKYTEEDVKKGFILPLFEVLGHG